MNGSARSTSMHEMRHTLAASVAVQLAAPDRYASAVVSWKIVGDHGQVVVEVGDPTVSGADLALSRQVAALHGIGPASKVPEVVALLKARRFDDLADTAKLSPSDLAHIQDVDEVQLVKVVLAVRHLEARLGLANMVRLAKSLWLASNQGVSDGWRLAALVPEAQARDALRYATAALAGAMA